MKDRLESKHRDRAARCAVDRAWPSSLRREPGLRTAARAPWVVIALAGLPPGQSAFAGDNDPLLRDRDGLVARAYFQTGVNAVAGQHLFWDYASTIAHPQISIRPQSGAGAMEPGIGFSRDLGGALAAYDKVSIVASGTRGIDAHGSGDTGRTPLEEGYLGLRSNPAGGPSSDVSLGPREFKAGAGMLPVGGEYISHGRLRRFLSGAWHPFGSPR